MTELKAKREFAGGAWRDSEDGKLDYEAFLSPAVLQAYAKYLHKHRRMPDGSLRDGDNWQNGIPQEVYVKSLMRHVVDVWLHHRGQSALASEPLDDAIGGVIFNAMGFWFEELKERVQDNDFDVGPISTNPWWTNARVETADGWKDYTPPELDGIFSYMEPGPEFWDSPDGQLAKRIQEEYARDKRAHADKAAQATVEGYAVPPNAFVKPEPIKVGDMVRPLWEPHDEAMLVVAVQGLWASVMSLDGMPLVNRFLLSDLVKSNG